MEVISKAQKRAVMPSGTNQVLDRRSLENDNKNLITFIKPGMHVLDVGCGTGAITKGIAALVGKQGKVVGIDASAELIDQAKVNHNAIKNISFVHQDLFEFESSEKFDLITSARTLQWLSNPLDAIFKMKSLLKRGSILSILDYNHTKIQWSPSIPQSMRYFYDQFLAWRADAGMNNQIADELAGMFSIAGLKRVTISDESEVSLRDDEDFRVAAGIWLKVVESRGNQMLSEDYIKEDAMMEAVHDYSHWLNFGQSMKLYLRSVSGYND